MQRGEKNKEVSAQKRVVQKVQKRQQAAGVSRRAAEKRAETAVRGGTDKSAGKGGKKSAKGMPTKGKSSNKSSSRKGSSKNRR